MVRTTPTFCLYCLSRFACSLHQPASLACPLCWPLPASPHRPATARPIRARRAVRAPRRPRRGPRADGRPRRLRPTLQRVQTLARRTRYRRVQAAACHTKGRAVTKPRCKSACVTWTPRAAGSTGVPRASTSRRLAAGRPANPMQQPTIPRRHRPPPRTRTRPRPPASARPASALRGSAPLGSALLECSVMISAARLATGADIRPPKRASARSIRTAATSSGTRRAWAWQRATAMHAPATTAAHPKTTRVATT